MMLATVVVVAFATLGFTGVAAQGTSNVQCIASYDWANNTIHQNPCLVGAYLQAVCNDGAFSVNSIPAGYHYIGPTNVSSTANACICSTPVYQLISACGACQNFTYISWSSWSFYCPSSLISPEGVYPETIPAGTAVPHWAYILPSTNGDEFDPTAAQLIGDSPESSQIVSSTTTSSSSTTSHISTTASLGVSVTVTTTSSTSTSSTGSGSGSTKSSSNTGAIAGGVVGGVIGLALVALLGFFFVKKRKRDSVRAAYAGSAAPTAPPMTQQGGSYINPGDAAGAGAAGAYVGTQNTGHTGGYQPTVGSGGQQPQYYNPSDPSTYPASFPSNAPSGYGQPGAAPGGYVQPGQGGYAAPPGAPGGFNEHPAGRYSGMPEV